MIVYVVTNKVNGKQYVGQTMQGLSKRKIDHKHRSKTYGPYFTNAIGKYGIDSFTWEIIATCSDVEQMFILEEAYVEVLNTLQQKDGSGGYNLHTGGNSHTISESLRRQLSGKNNVGYNHTIRTFYHKDGRVFTGTKHDFYTKFGLDDGRVSDVISNKKGCRSVKGWVFDKKYLPKEYTFYHRDGREFRGTKYDFCKKHGLRGGDVLQMVQGKKEHRSVKDWVIDKEYLPRSKYETKERRSRGL